MKIENIKVSLRLQDLDAIRSEADCSRCQHVPVLEQAVLDHKRKLKEAEEHIEKELSGGCVRLQHELADLRLKFNAAELRANEMTAAYNDEQEARKNAEADCKRAYDELRTVSVEVRDLRIEKIKATEERDKALNGQIAVAEGRTNDLETRLLDAIGSLRQIRKVADDNWTPIDSKISWIRSIVENYEKEHTVEFQNQRELLGTMNADQVSVIVPTAEPVKDGISADHAQIMKQKKCKDRRTA